MARSTPTLHEVARLAGVSTATVSRVIHGGAGVSSALQQRVRAAIAELGYRPSHLGRALVQRRHGAIGVVFPGLYGPYYSEVIHGIESVAIEHRLAVMILGTHLLAGASDHVLSLADRTDGLAVLGGTLNTPDLQHVTSQGKPVVLMAQHRTLDLPTLRVDNRTSTRDLTAHLLAEHGLRTLAFVGGTENSPDVSDRWLGFTDAHAAVGVDPPEEPVDAALEVGHGRRAGLRILARAERPDGIVCANDEIALGVLSAARSLGLRVPDDVAVTGWDDIPIASHATPPLTTVHQPTRDLGAQTARMLIGLINGDDVPPDLHELPTTPIYRRSCGCPYEDRTDDVNAMAATTGGDPATM